jgi:Flp pilus assembly protein TadG
MTTARRTRDRGAAAVEFVLVLPVLLLIIFGIIDFGRMLYTQITLSQAAQSAARAGAILGVDKGKTEGQNAASGLDPSALQVAVTACADSTDNPPNATATLTYHFTFVTPLAVLANLNGGGVDLVSRGSSPCIG